MISQYFEMKEFACPCCGANGMQEEFLKRLEDARTMAGIPFVITSAFRCDSHNKEVGGKVNSSHLDGWAGDIACNSEQRRYTVFRSCLLAGFRRFGPKKKFIHVDCDPSKNPRRLWI